MQCIIFDAEGVVIHTEQLWDAGQRIFLGRRGILYDRAQIKHMMVGQSLADGVKILQEHFQFPGDPHQLAAERREIMAELFENDVQFVPGFEKFFNRCAARGLQQCVATALSPDLFVAVDRRLQISDRFDGCVFFTAEVEDRPKSDPAIFLHAARRMGRNPDECLVIEDSPAGLAGARAAGMRCAALTTTFPADMLREADEIHETFTNIRL